MVDTDFAVIIGSNEDFENLVIKAVKPVFIQCWAGYLSKFLIKKLVRRLPNLEALNKRLYNS
jgi:hypothetical protein